MISVCRGQGDQMFHVWIGVSGTTRGPRLKNVRAAACGAQDRVDALAGGIAAGHERQRVEIALGGDSLPAASGEQPRRVEGPVERHRVADAGRGETMEVPRRRARTRSPWRAAGPP